MTDTQILITENSGSAKWVDAFGEVIPAEYRDYPDQLRAYELGKCQQRIIALEARVAELEQKQARQEGEL